MRRILWWGFIGWVVLLIVLFSIDVKIYFFNFWQEYGFFLLFLLSAIGIGSKLINLFRISGSPFLENLLFSASLGIVSIAIIAMFLGILGLLYPMVFYLLLLFFIILSLKELKFFGNELNTWSKGLSFFSLTRNYFDLILTGFLVIAVLIIFVYSMIPPLYFDDLVYQLAIPNYFILNHKITFIPSNVYSNSPLYAEMVYMVGLLLKGEMLVKLFQFSFGILSLLAIYQFTKKYIEEKKGLISSVVFLSVPMLSFLAVICKNDLILAFFQFMGIYSFLNFIASKERGWLFLSSIFMGFSLGIKYIGGLFFIIFLIFINLFYLRKETLKKIFIVNFILLFIAIIVASPWFLKNIVMVKNPVYPFFYKIFDGKELDKSVFKKYYYYAGAPTEFSPMYFLRSIFNITFKSAYMGISAPATGPVFLIFIPLFFFIRKKQKSVNFLITIALVNFIASLFFSFYPRFILISFYFFSGLIGFIISSLIKQNLFSKYFKHFFVFLIGFQLFSTAYLLEKYFSGYTLFLGLKNKQAYLNRTIPNSPYEVIEFANKNLSQNAKILFIGESRTYYIKRKYEASTNIDIANFKKIFKKAESASELIDALEKEGFTHVIYNEKQFGYGEKVWKIMDFESQREKERFNKFLTNLNLIFESNKVYLYEIKTK